MRLRSASRLPLRCLDALAFFLARFLFAGLDALASPPRRASSSASMLRSASGLVFSPRRLRSASLSRPRPLLRPGLLLGAAFLLRLLAALALDHREPFLLLGAACGERLLLLLERLDPLRLRFALSLELGEALRLLAFAFALGCDVLALALALHAARAPGAGAPPRSAAAGPDVRLLLERGDAFAFLLALLLVLARRRSSSSASCASSTTTASTGSTRGPAATSIGASPSLKTSTDTIAACSSTAYTIGSSPIEQRIPAHCRNLPRRFGHQSDARRSGPLQDRHEDDDIPVGHVLVATHDDRQPGPMAQQRPDPRAASTCGSTGDRWFSPKFR